MKPSLRASRSKAADKTITGNIIAITGALRETAAAVVQANDSIDRDCLREHDRVFINFPDDRKLDHAEHLVREIAVAIPSLRDQVQNQFKRRLESLKKLLKLVAATDNSTPVAIEIQGEKEDSNMADPDGKILLENLRPIQMQFEMGYEKLRRESSTVWIALWNQLNCNLTRIEDVISEFKNKQRNRVNYNLIPGAFAPVQICSRGRRFLNVPVEIAMADALVGLCRNFGHCGAQAIDIEIQADELTLARRYTSLFLGCDFAGFEISQDDNPQTGQSFQTSLNELLASFCEFLKKFQTALESPTSGRSKAEKKSQPIAAPTSAETARTTPTTSYTVVIKTVSNVFVKGDTRPLGPQAVRALVGLAVLGELRPDTSITFSTKRLIKLISNSPTPVHKQWFRCKKEMLNAMPSLRLDGKMKLYAIHGLNFDTKLTVDQLKTELNNTQ